MSNRQAFIERGMAAVELKKVRRRQYRKAITERVQLCDRCTQGRAVVPALVLCPACGIGLCVGCAKGGRCLDCGNELWRAA